MGKAIGFFEEIKKFRKVVKRAEKELVNIAENARLKLFKREKTP